MCWVLVTNLLMSTLEDVELSTDNVPTISVLKCELSSSILSADAGNWLRVMTDIIHKWNELVLLNSQMSSF